MVINSKLAVPNKLPTLGQNMLLLFFSSHHYIHQLVFQVYLNNNAYHCHFTKYLRFYQLQLMLILKCKCHTKSHF